MKKGTIHIYTGEGRGKSPAALGRAVQAAAFGASVVIIQFLKGKGLDDNEFVRRLEPEIKFFRFERSDENFDELSPEKKEEEILNIRNGINYARKVLSTEECSLLILDEVLALVEKGILSAQDLKNILDQRGETDVIMTGAILTDEVRVLADEVSKIDTLGFEIS
ncbi:MAG: cob(I)yrinic acid a,c-diamide adenosyltransferase [Lachnospiraceae bacterium]|nr:cob(I)yrinic acid a,c-diamide adenosyltransferase [Lachnospiraceae bacterium]